MGIKPLNACQHENCDKEGSVWTIEGYDPPPQFCLCDDHAAEFGFCVYCGAFIGGTEDVFLTGRSGMCFDCYSEMEREFHRSYSEGDND